MKINILYLALLLIGFKSFSQNVEPTQHQFNIFNNPNYLIDANDNNFQQKHIQTGSIWTSDYRMNEVLGVNTFWSHNYYYDASQGSNFYYLPEYFTKNSDLIMQLWGISSCSEFTPMKNISFQYEPRLYIDQPGGNT